MGDMRPKICIKVNFIYNLFFLSLPVYLFFHLWLLSIDNDKRKLFFKEH